MRGGDSALGREVLCLLYMASPAEISAVGDNCRLKTKALSMPVFLRVLGALLAKTSGSLKALSSHKKVMVKELSFTIRYDYGQAH